MPKSVSRASSGGRVPEVKIRVFGFRLFTVDMTMAPEKHSRLIEERSVSVES